MPRWRGHPAASEIDLLARLDKFLERRPGHRETFRESWPPFERRLRSRVAFEDGLPEPEALRALLEEWHAEYRTAPDPSVEARFFEAIRMDVLRAYYSSPAGWASVGYRGPVRRTQPSRPRREHGCSGRGGEAVRLAGDWVIS